MRGLKRQVLANSFGLRMSHLLQMRGLKHKRPTDSNGWQVASFTDAWIETFFIGLGYARLLVASFTDAWIETGLKESRRSR